MRLLRAILEYVLVVCFVLEFNTPYMIFPLLADVVRYLPFLILLILLLSGIKGRNLIAVFPYLFLYLVCSLPALIFTSIKIRFVLYFLVFQVLLWLYFYFNKFDSEKDYLSIFKKFSNFTLLLAISSLVFWIGGSVLHILSPTFFVPSTWAGERLLNCYYGIYFETQTLRLFGIEMYRNSGLFQEGPMYNMVLCSALLVELFFVERKSNWRIGVLVVTIFSTFTTTGQFFLLVMGGGWIISHYDIRKYFFLICLLLAGIGFVGNFFLREKMADEDSGGKVSVEIRKNSMENCLQLGLSSPFLGIGYYNPTDKIEEHSNSIFEIFAYGGFYGLIYYIGILLGVPLFYWLKRRDRRFFFVTAGVFLVLMVTAAYYTYLLRLFLAVSLSLCDMKPFCFDIKRRFVGRLQKHIC